MKTYTCLEFCEHFGITCTLHEARWYIISLAAQGYVRTWLGFDGRRLVEAR